MRGWDIQGLERKRIVYGLLDGEVLGYGRCDGCIGLFGMSCKYELTQYKFCCYCMRLQRGIHGAKRGWLLAL